MANDTEALQVIKTGVQMAGEAMVPGGSNLVTGDFKQGAVYAALGFAARAYLGLPGLLLVSASSLSKAMTGKHLYQYIDEMGPTPKHKLEETSVMAPAHDVE